MNIAIKWFQYSPFNQLKNKRLLDNNTFSVDITIFCFQTKKKHTHSALEAISAFNS